MRNLEGLLLVLKYHGKIRGRKRFQKLIFLLKKKFDINFTYKFVPYLHGPYSKHLQWDINLLRIIGLIDVNPEPPYEHSLSKKGIEKAKEIEKKIDKSILKKLIKAVEYLKYRSTAELTSEAKELIKMGDQKSPRY